MVLILVKRGIRITKMAVPDTEHLCMESLDDDLDAGPPIPGDEQSSWLWFLVLPTHSSQI